VKSEIGCDAFFAFAHQRNLTQFVQRDQSQLHGIVAVVRVVCRAIGRVDRLHFQQWCTWSLFVNARALTLQYFKRQIQSIGFSYDWDREVDTTDPDYYKWTQWIFLQLYKKGLAYESELPINWCPSCKTGLANEEVQDGKCDRCGSQTTKKMLRQWVLKITEYADRLLEDLKEVEWPNSIKLMQENWIGKSYGAEVDFEVKDSEEKVKVYTTRPDTLFGATYMVLSPEHPLVYKLVTDEHKEDVEKYKDFALMKSDLERTDLNKDKSGQFIGAYAINPVNGEEIPIWIADYVLMGYGTGAIMAVPGHDRRDWEFAKKFDLPIVEIIEGGNVDEDV